MRHFKRNQTSASPSMLSRLLITGLVAALAGLAQSPPVPPLKGMTLAVRTIDAVRSSEAEIGQSHRAALDAPIRIEGKEIAPKGADCVLRIVELKEAGKLAGKRQLKLVLAQVRLNGELVSIDSEPVTMEGKGKGKGTVTRAGTGAAVGAAVGGLLGRGRGALIGAGAGAAAGTAVAVATSGPEIRVSPETVLNFVVQ